MFEARPVKGIGYCFEREADIYAPDGSVVAVVRTAADGGKMARDIAEYLSVIRPAGPVAVPDRNPFDAPGVDDAEADVPALAWEDGAHASRAGAYEAEPCIGGWVGCYYTEPGRRVPEEVSPRAYPTREGAKDWCELHARGEAGGRPGAEVVTETLERR